MKKTCVIALGGNALSKKGEKRIDNIIKTIKGTCEQLLPLIKKFNAVFTFGNGPQVGFLALQNELAKKYVPQMPLDVLGAESQGQIGYLLEQQLRNALKKSKIKKPIVTLVTQVLVNKNDKAFKNPTKPIGLFYSKEGSQKLKKDGFSVMEDAGRGYRRVVASPKPLKVVEAAIIKELLKSAIVIAVGGGGVPIYETKEGLKGCEAVIDKDYASVCLAKEINADLLLLLTSIDKVYLNFNKKNQKGLKKITTKEAKKYLKEGHFYEGSMKPKIEASIDFLESRKKGKVIITSIDKIKEALKGKAGTSIVR